MEELSDENVLACETEDITCWCNTRLLLEWKIVLTSQYVNTKYQDVSCIDDDSNNDSETATELEKELFTDCTDSSDEVSNFDSNTDTVFSNELKDGAIDSVENEDKELHMDGEWVKVQLTGWTIGELLIQ